VSLSAARPTAVRDVLLVLLTFGAGAVDAISFLALGRVFTGNMTGNLVLLGLAAGQAKGSEVVRSAVSLGAFCVGVLLAVHVVNLISRRKLGRRGSPVWPVGVSVVLALEVLVQGGFLGGWVAVNGHPSLVFTAVLVGLSALAMGMQSDAVAALGVAGVTTTYVTGTMTGLLRALAIGGINVPDRVRRAAVLAGLLLGAVVCAVLLVHARRFAPVLPLAATVTVLATAVWRFHGARGRGD
jgi:uncharacterized membrane protein YoaK (UPF0700 family)